MVSILFLLLTVSAEEGGGLLPGSLSRPQKGEAARYPQDLIIGELGRGEAPEAVYYYAKKILDSFISQKQEAEGMDRGIWRQTKAGADAISPQKFRLGGGRQEADGSVSFIFRFIGREQWLAGEIYVRFQDAMPVVRQEETAVQGGGTAAEAGNPDKAAAPAEIEYTKAGWQVDDIILDDPKRIGENGTAYQYDFSPYERFF